MPWYKVVVEKSGPAADEEGQTLMDKFGPEFRKAGLPDTAKIFRCETPSGGYVFYFNPAAALAAMEIFPLFGGTECLEVPNLDGCKKVRF